MANKTKSILTASYSFPQGDNRQVEELMWNGYYGQNAGKLVTISKGVQATFREMVLYGRGENIIASALALRGIMDLVRPLPYKVLVPSNLMSGDWLNQPVDSPHTFMAQLLQQHYGVQVANFDSSKGGWVIIDPDLMDEKAVDFIAAAIRKTKKPALIIIKRGVPVPVSLRLLESAIYFPTNALAPFVDPVVEQALFQLGTNNFSVMGGGDRLIPTIIGVCDSVLQNTIGFEGKIPNEIRREIVGQFVQYIASDMRKSTLIAEASVFNASWWNDSASTMRQAAGQFLNYFGFAVDDIPQAEPPYNTYDKTGDFAIVPRWM